MYFDFEEAKPTETTFKDMPMEPAMDNPDLIEIYRQIMLIDLFQTQFGGWISKLPLQFKLLVELLLLILLAGIAFGVYKAYKNMDKLKRQLNRLEKQMARLVNKVKGEMSELCEALYAYFSQEHEAPVKVKTVKDGTRSHEFHED